MIDVKFDKGTMSRSHIKGDEFELVADLATLVHVVYTEISKENMFAGIAFEHMFRASVDSIFHEFEDVADEAISKVMEKTGMSREDAVEFIKSANDLSAKEIYDTLNKASEKGQSIES